LSGIPYKLKEISFDGIAAGESLLILYHNATVGYSLSMSDNSLGELYFIIIMMVLILIICAAAVFIFVRQYKREINKSELHDKNENDYLENEQKNSDQE
jgi:large-conductance mechanosensitive channel